MKEGVEYPDDKQSKISYGLEYLPYIGYKWGGKCLRAPEIYFKILDKEKDKLVRLDKIANISGYIHGFNVGSKFPKVKFVDNISKLKRIYIDENSHGVIEYGVKKYKNSRLLGDYLYLRMFGDRFLVIVNCGKVFGQKFYKIILKNKKDNDVKINIGLLLNSTFYILQNKVLLYSTWGLGAISINSDHLFNILVLEDFRIDNHNFLCFLKREIKSIFSKLGLDPNRSIREQQPNPLPDRKKLDDIVFDAIELTEDERKDVYWAVAKLVQNRLN